MLFHVSDLIPTERAVKSRTAASPLTNKSPRLRLISFHVYFCFVLSLKSCCCIYNFYITFVIKKQSQVLMSFDISRYLHQPINFWHSLQYLTDRDQKHSVNKLKRNALLHLSVFTWPASSYPHWIFVLYLSSSK